MKRTAGAAQGCGFDGQQRAKALLRIITQALMIGRADQQAVEAQGLRPRAAKMAPAQESMIDPAKSVGRSLA